MVFITVMESVYSAVRTDSLHKSDYVSSLRTFCKSYLQIWIRQLIHIWNQIVSPKSFSNFTASFSCIWTTTAIQKQHHVSTIKTSCLTTSFKTENLLHAFKNQCCPIYSNDMYNYSFWYITFCCYTLYINHHWYWFHKTYEKHFVATHTSLEERKF